jgi:ABC-type polysaccharide/polyol phosphate transport system ATPase subunit
MNAISFQQVSKTFPRHIGQMLLRDRVKHLFETRKADPFYALKNVSFNLSQGESLGVVGSNGAGKSTLLALATQLVRPSTGKVLVNGRVAPILELGSGFHPDLTGAENVYLNASLLGFSKAQVRSLYSDIVEFADIGDFLQEPLRTYSNGMVVRLAFAVAVTVDPDILIIDEVLAVGDAAFQAKCVDRIRAFRRAGKTFVCVSHSKEALMEICDTAIWLDHGEVLMQGPIAKVWQAYSGRSAVPA